MAMLVSFREGTSQVCMLFANIVVKVATVTPYLAWIRWCTFMYFSMAGLIEVSFRDGIRRDRKSPPPLKPEDIIESNKKYIDFIDP